MNTKMLPGREEFNFYKLVEGYSMGIRWGFNRDSIGIQ
jgi:hypothetical protein